LKVIERQAEEIRTLEADLLIQKEVIDRLREVLGELLAVRRSKLFSFLNKIGVWGWISDVLERAEQEISRRR
ncbi:hypothetical protein EG19_02105, partial [Thermoanaerobaculum aquaticum]